MDKLSTLASAVSLASNIGTLRKGYMLCKKENKTEFEEKAAKAYTRIIVGMILAFVVFGLVMLVTMVCITPSMPTGARRTGRVENGNVRYVQGEVKYATFDELRIEEYDLQDGDMIYLYFDTNDELSAAVPEKALNHAWTIELIILGVGLVGILFFAFYVCRITPYGKAWYEYLSASMKQAE